MDHLVNYLNWFLSVPYQVEGKFQAAWNQFSAAISINSGRWEGNKLVYNTGLVVFVFFHNSNVWNDMLLCLDIFCKGNVVELLRVLSLKFLGSQAQIFHSVTRLNLFFGGPDFDSFAALF